MTQRRPNIAPSLSFKLCVLLFAIVPLAVVAIAQNRTVDDTYGDSVTKVVPTYVPGLDGVLWRSQPGCQTCVLQPDASQAHNGTWHDVMYIGNGSVPAEMGVLIHFSGSAIYVFNIIPNGPTTGQFVTDIMFVLDGGIDASITWTPNLSSDFIYNHLVYSRNMANGNHSLLMRTPNNNPLNGSVILFDYAIYTYEDADETSPATSAAESTSLTSSNPSQNTSSTPTSTPTPSNTGSSLGTATTDSTPAANSSTLLTHSSPSATAGTRTTSTNASVSSAPATSATSTTSTTKSDHHIGTSAGIATSATVAVGVLLACIVWFLRRRHGRWRHRRNHRKLAELNLNDDVRPTSTVPLSTSFLPPRTPSASQSHQPRGESRRPAAVPAATPPMSETPPPVVRRPLKVRIRPGSEEFASLDAWILSTRSEARASYGGSGMAPTVARASASTSRMHHERG